MKSLLTTLFLFAALSASPVQAGTGTVEVLHADLHSGKARFETYIRPDEGGRYLVSQKPDARFQHGDRVQAAKIKGAKSGPKWSISPLMKRATLKAPAVVGNHTLAVIMLTFQDAPAPTWMTQAQLRLSVFDAPTSVAKWFQSESYGLLAFSGDVYGPVTVPLSRVGCPYASAGNYGDQAIIAQVGAANFALYQHILYVFTGGTGCPWGGLSTVGGSPSRSWAGGDTDVTRHELGHALGLWHSHSLLCIGVSVCAPGQVADYGDTKDAMGSGASQSFNAVQKGILGWSTPRVVSTNGSYPLASYESFGDAIRVGTSNGDTYYAERRSGGFLVHLNRGGGNGIYLLDMTPVLPDWGRPWLPVGGSFSAPGITLTAVTDSTVQVAMDGAIQPPPPPPPGNVVLAITGNTAIGREMTFRGTLVGSTSLTAIADTTGITPKYIAVDPARKTWTVRVTGLFKGPHTFTVLSGNVSASTSFVVVK